MEELSIPTYIINLKKRKDRLDHIISQFKDKKEFELHIQEACENSIGAIGLWESICQIIRIAVKENEDVILFCEDDHEFTEYYDTKKFISAILEAHRLGANLLLGGISGGFSNILPLKSGLFWLDAFWGTQFVVVFKNFYHAILNEPFSNTDVADAKFSEMTSNKFVIHPLISVQKDFGYSDITKANNIDSNLHSLFETVRIRMDRIYEVYNKR